MLFINDRFNISQKSIDAASSLTQSRIWSRRLIEGHLYSNYNTIDSSEILLSWCIYYFTKAVQLYLILLPSFFKVFPQQERMRVLSSVSSMNSFGQNPSFRSSEFVRDWSKSIGGGGGAVAERGGVISFWTLGKGWVVQCLPTHREWVILFLLWELTHIWHNLQER